MIDKLKQYPIGNQNTCYGHRAPSNWELMEKINELVEEVNRLKEKRDHTNDVCLCKEQPYYNMEKAKFEGERILIPVENSLQEIELVIKK